MGRKIDQNTIAQIPTLYAEIGTYSGVAQRLGISSTTVSRYIKEAQSIKSYSTSMDPLPIEEITSSSLLSFSHLTPEEKQSYNDWIKEFE